MTQTSRGETILSIHSMIQRFRETKPTPQKERQKQRQEGRLKEMWWMSKESRAEGNDRDKDLPTTDGDIYNSMDGDQLLNSPNTRSWKELGTQPVLHRYKLASSDLAVDRLMSQDIQRFLGVGEKKVHRATNPRELVLPSPFLAPVPVNTSWTNPSMNNLIPPFGPSKPVRTGYDIQSGEEEPYPDFLRRSLALDPSTYTGNAELRGEIALTPTQNDGSSPDEQTVEVIRKGAKVEDVSTAAGVASDLDVVLTSLRNGMNREQLVEYPGQGIARKNSPVNLSQIAHDLDAKLLEFTLMAKAREQLADESDQAEEAEKFAWRQGERQRIERKVRQENAALLCTASGQDIDWQVISGSVEDADQSFRRFPSINASREANLVSYRPDRDNQVLDAFSSSHPPLSLSPLGEGSQDILKNADPPVEVVAHQMAEVLRYVEAEIKRIQAVEVSETCGQKDRENKGFNETLIALGSPICSEKGDLDSGNLGKESLHVRKVSKVSPKEQSTVTKATDDLKTTHENKPGVMAQKTSNAAGNGWPGSITQQNTALPIEGFHVTVPQTWLYGQATLQQTGQSISAELEVAMLCMQKRLDQQRTIHGEQSEVTEVEKKDIKGKENDEDEKTRQKEKNKTQSGGKLEGSLEGRLQQLADGMATRRVHGKYIDLDYELGFKKGFADKPSKNDGGKSPALSFHQGVGVHLNGENVRSFQQRLMEESEHGPQSSSRSYLRTPPSYTIPNGGSMSPRREPGGQKARDARHIKNSLDAPKEGGGNSLFDANLVQPTSEAKLVSTLTPFEGTHFIPATFPSGRNKKTREDTCSLSPYLGSSSFIEGSSQLFDIRASDEKLQQYPFEHHQWQDTEASGSLHRTRSWQKGRGGGSYHDERDSGLAIERARLRLRTIQKTRRGMSANSNVTCDLHKGVPGSPISADLEAVSLPPVNEGQIVLDRLKNMRQQYS